VDVKPDFHSLHGLTVFILPWIVSGLGIWMTELTGRKDKKGWAIGVIVQLIWFVFVILTAAWGFIPLNVIRFYQYARNYYRWKKEGEDLEVQGDFMVSQVPRFGGTDTQRTKYPGLD
jgi:hypothetical protein